MRLTNWFPHATLNVFPGHAHYTDKYLEHRRQGGKGLAGLRHASRAGSLIPASLYVWSFHVLSGVSSQVQRLHCRQIGISIVSVMAWHTVQGVPKSPGTDTMLLVTLHRKWIDGWIFGTLKFTDSVTPVQVLL